MNRSKWISHAYVESAKYVRMMRKPRTIEQIRVALGERVPEPKDQRWWGAVALLLISGHHIKRVDYAPAKSSHGSAKPTYVACRVQFAKSMP